MSAREDAGGRVETTVADIAVSSPLPPPRRATEAGPTARSRRSRQVTAAALAVAAVLAVVVGTAWALSGDDPARATPAGAAAKKKPGAAAPSAALTLAVEAPSTVTAGTAATIVVRYSDSSGIFSGTTEDWGDGVGTSSLKQGACGAGAPAPKALTGSYTLTHTWDKAGTYAVSIGVASYTCAGTVATEEQAAKTVSVTVSPR